MTPDHLPITPWFAVIGLFRFSGQKGRPLLIIIAISAAILINLQSVLEYLPSGVQQAVSRLVLPNNPALTMVGNALLLLGITIGLVRLASNRHPKKKVARNLKRKGDLLGAAEVLRQAGLFKDALPLFQKSKAWQQAAEMASELGRDLDAATFFRRAGGRQLADAARLFGQNGQLEMAQKCNHELATWHMNSNRYDEAIEAWVKAGELNMATKASSLAIQEHRLKASHTAFPTAVRAAEQTRNHRCLAQLRELESNWSAAGHAWHMANEHQKAAQNFRRAGLLEDAAKAENAAGRPREAAQLRVEQVRRLQGKLDTFKAQGATASGDRERIEREIERELNSLIPILGEQGLNDELVELLNAAGRAKEAVDHLVIDGNEGAAADLARETQQWAIAGEILERIGRFGEASDVFELGGDLERAAGCAVKGGEDERALHIYRSLDRPTEAAHCLARLGYLQEALKELHRVGEIGDACALLRSQPGPVPDIPDIMMEMAMWLQANESVEQAIACLQRAVRGVALRSNRLQPAVSLARLLFKEGETAAALGHLERVLGFDFSHAEAQELRQEISTAVSVADAAAAAKDPASAAADQRYEILNELGRGGMGVVYRARDTRLDREVAIKVLRTTAPEEVRRLEQEAKLAATLNHPGIVTVFDFEPGFDGYFIAMELVDGQALDVMVKNDRPRIQGLLADLLTRMAEAVAYAHTRKVVHRDLKPGNILLTSDGKVKVVDFGIATRLDSQQSVNPKVVGTPYYMAPEQIRGEVPTPATDIYAFGATAFHLATGRPPFRRGNVIEAHLSELPPDPCSLEPELSRELADIILKCLEKEPEDRYANAGALRDVLQSL